VNIDLIQITQQGYYFLEINASWEVYQFKRIENKINTGIKLV
jgi:glutathione synthase/RimK-type ligase-like ATP-grasp enzyme